MADLFRKYRCRYVWSHRFGGPHHSYEVIGARGGLHLHISEFADSSGATKSSAGLELHSRFAPDDSAPTNDRCWLLKCPCWHDGTTLYAEERYLPMFITGIAPDEMLRRLCDEADRRFPNALSSQIEREHSR